MPSIRSSARPTGRSSSRRWWTRLAIGSPSPSRHHLLRGRAESGARRARPTRLAADRDRVREASPGRAGPFRPSSRRSGPDAPPSRSRGARRSSRTASLPPAGRASRGRGAPRSPRVSPSSRAAPHRLPSPWAPTYPAKAHAAVATSRRNLCGLRGLDELDPVPVGIAHEAQARPALPHAIGRALGLDSLSGEALQRRVEIVDRDRDVPVAGAELVAVDAEFVRQLEPIAVAGEAHEDVDRLVADRQPAALLEAERLVEGDRPVDVGDAVAGMNELHTGRAYRLHVVPQQPKENAVDPVAVPPVRPPPDTLADE